MCLEEEKRWEKMRKEEERRTYLGDEYNWQFGKKEKSKFVNNLFLWLINY